MNITDTVQDLRYTLATDTKIPQAQVNRKLSNLARLHTSLDLSSACIYLKCNEVKTY